jgi:transcriptional regulator with XRE-family HTH domain
MVETMDDGVTGNPVGDRLRAAREARGLTLDEIASMTRVPTRHLQHIENGDWDSLPAVTYSVGFARAYASAVGLDGREIGSELRNQLGAPQSGAATAPYEPADPARVPPRSLAIIAAVIAVLLVAGYLLWRGSAVSEGDPQAEAAAVDTPIIPQPQAMPAPAGTRPAAPPPGAVTGPVVLTASDDVWLRVSDGGTTLVQKTLKAGESYQVPPTAQKPTLRVGRPDALRVAVGQTAIPQVGPSGQPIGNVSLLPADLAARLQSGAPGASPQSGAAQAAGGR